MAATRFPHDPPVTRELARSHKLNDAEYAKALARARPRADVRRARRLQRDVERALLVQVARASTCARLPTKGPRVIQGPGENAGVVDIGDGFAAVFKMESHNHPIVHRAVPGRGHRRRRHPARRLHDGRAPHREPRTRCASAAPIIRARRELLRGVVAGIGGYGNCIGVPTVGGELQFDARYDGNILVNAFTCGVARTDRIFYGRASGVGNPILYIGAKTGRDGIHGATMASRRVLRGRPDRSGPTVQVGDPFMEKLLSRRASSSSPRTCSRASRTWAPPGSRRRASRWRGARATASSSISTRSRAARRR